MTPILNFLQRLTPYLVIIWALYSLLFRPAEIMWGLPSTWWYTMGIFTALFIILIDFIERRFPR